MTRIVPGVPDTAAAQSAFAVTLLDEFVRGGMADLVLCPGSRSTPLALAALASAGLRLHVRLDERSAGFFAIGRALSTGRPVGIVVTSGTAAAELTASVVEADLAGVPLVVVTADRPPELRGVGAPQTIDQVKLFGASVRRFEDPGPIRAGTEVTWRPLASRLIAAARQDPGPVHLNLPMVEPLDAEASTVPEGRPGRAPWRSERRAGTGAVGNVSETFSAKRVILVAGRGVDEPESLVEVAAAHGWALLADPLSGARFERRHVVAASDALLRDHTLREQLRPDVVVLLGAAPASKALGEALVEWDARVVAVGLPGTHWPLDPHGVVSETVVGSASQWARHTLSNVSGLEAPADYLAAWSAADGAAQACFDDELATTLSEPAVARLLSRELPDGVALVVSSSMPVRDLEWFGATSPVPPRVLANRGANGIDGVVSTALGAASGSRVACLIGDLAFLHDAGSLADGVGADGGTCVFVVLDNRGGGIFSFLPQRASVPTEAFERVFATPPTVDVASIAAGYGANTHVVMDLDSLRSALEVGLAGQGVTVVVVRAPDRDTNVELHRVLATRAAAAARAAIRA